MKLRQVLQLMREVPVDWEPPIHSQIKVDIDGAAKGKLGSAWASCVLRGSRGRWLTGEIMNQGVTSSANVEIVRGVLQSLI